MAFQAKTWGWKGLRTRLLLVPVLAGSAAGIAPAQSDSTGQARALVAQAHRAMQSGDLATAERYARQAQQLRAPLAANEPRPESVLAEIHRVRQTTADGRHYIAAAQAPSDASPAEPKELIKLAKQALAAGHLDQAQDFATRANQAATARGHKWGLFDDTPASIMKDVQTARAKADKLRSEELFKEARSVFAKPTTNDAERLANLDHALNLAYQAKNLHGPYSIWDLGDRPDKLITEIESIKAQLRKQLPNGEIATRPTPTPTLTSAIQRVTGMGKPEEKSVTTAGLTTPQAPTTGSKLSTTLGPAKAAVAQMVMEGRKALAEERVLEARSMAMEARKLAETRGVMNAFAPNEDSPEALFQACQAKGREMILALTQDADRQAAAKKFAEADAAMEYAMKLSEGLGFYSKPLADQRSMIADFAKKGQAPTQRTAVTASALQSAPAKSAAPSAPVQTVAAVSTPNTEGLKVPTLTPTPSTEVKTPTMPAPAAPMAPVMPSPTVAQAPMAPAQVDLIEQATKEMQRGELEMARKIAIQAHNTNPQAKEQAQALLRSIDAAEQTKRQATARTAYENGLGAVEAKRYENALAIFQRIDPNHLTAEQKAGMEQAMAKCLAETNPMKETVTLAQGETPAQPGVAKVGSSPAPAQTPTPMPVGDSLADQQKALGEVAYQKLRQDGFTALTEANAAWGRGDTDAALQLLNDYAAKVRASNQSTSRQAMLVRPVEERIEHFRLLKHHTDFIANEAKEKNDIRRDMIATNVAEAQKHEEIKRKVKQINELTKAGKFKEAELAAAQAKQLDPEDPTLTYIAEQSKMRRRTEEFKQIRSEQEQFVLTGLNEAERQGPAPTLDNPLLINPERQRLAAMRGMDSDVYMRARTPAEMVIEQKLNAPFDFKFENATLRDVIKEIRTKSGLNITTDDAAIDDEKIVLDEVMVTEEVKDLSLRDGLTILLAKARLSHIVENNVVKITTEKRSKGRMTTKVFHVMELVTPIPEYAPAPHHRLDTAIAQGRGTIPGAMAAAASSGGATPFIPQGGLQSGQMVSGGQGVPGQGDNGFGGGNLQNNLQSMPVAMSPQRAQYADQLKKLITGMIRPHAWQTLGGPGNLEYYDIGGALVVNQTADVIREVADLLESLRRLQDLSVAVEIRVISLSEAFFERVGVDFSMNIKTNNTTFERQLATNQFRPEPFLNDINNKNVLVGWNPATGGFTPDLDIPIRSTSYGLSIPPFGGYQGALGPTTNGGLAMGLAFLNDIQVYMFLEAAQGNRRVNVMQAPKITLFNGQTATVFVGDVAYFTTGLQVFNVGGQFVYLPQNIAFPIGQGIDPNTGTQGGVSVTVQAVISADRRFVRMNLSPTLTALASATVPLFPVSTFITPVFEGGSQGQPVPFTQFFQQPSFSEITAQTTVAVPDGGTVLLGGLKTLAQARNEFGPPVISHIPYLNRLFKNVGVGQETRHVMLMVTPRIIINSEEEARQVGEGGGLLPPQN